MAQFASTLRIKTPTDIRNKKVRFVGNSQLGHQMARSLHATPVSISFSEIFSAIQQNQIDVVESTLLRIKHYKYYERAKYITLTNHRYFGNILVFSHPFFLSLTSEMQDHLYSISAKATYRTNRLTNMERLRAFDFMKQHGAEIMPPAQQP